MIDAETTLARLGLDEEKRRLMPGCLLILLAAPVALYVGFKTWIKNAFMPAPRAPPPDPKREKELHDQAVRLVRAEFDEVGRITCWTISKTRKMEKGFGKGRDMIGKMSNKDYYGPGGAGEYGQPQNTYYTNGPSSINVPPQAYGAPPPVNGNRPVSISPFFPSLPPIWPWKMLIEVGDGVRPPNWPGMLPKLLRTLLPTAPALL